MSNISRRFAMLLVGAAGLAALAAPVLAQDAKFYNGAPRTYLYNPDTDVCFKDTSQYKKEGPYTIGFSNAGLGDSWRVVMLHSMEAAAAKHKDQIKKLIITDAGHDDAKQVADIQDLMSRGVDLLIVSANTQQALDPAVSQAMAAGHPGRDGRPSHRLRQFRHLRDRVRRHDGPPLRAMDRREAGRQGQRHHAGGPGRLEPDRKPRKAGARGFRAVSRHQGARHGLFRLEPGQGQAGHAGDDRQVRQGHQRGLVGARAADARARSRPSSKPATRPARSRRTPRRTSTVRCRWRSSTRCRCSRSAIRRRWAASSVDVALQGARRRAGAVHLRDQLADRRLATATRRRRSKRRSAAHRPWSCRRARPTC